MPTNSSVWPLPKCSRSATGGKIFSPLPTNMRSEHFEMLLFESSKMINIVIIFSNSDNNNKKKNSNNNSFVWRLKRSVGDTLVLGLEKVLLACS